MKCEQIKCDYCGKCMDSFSAETQMAVLKLPRASGAAWMQDRFDLCNKDCLAEFIVNGLKSCSKQTQVVDLIQPRDLMEVK